MIAYVTDVEGRWDKLVAFADENPCVRLDGDRLVLADGAVLVFGGDAVDRGPAGRRIVRALRRAVEEYGERIVVLAGNRDINKLRLRWELRGKPRAGAPVGASLPDLLRWTLEKTMGAPKAFEHRRTELGGVTDDAVVASFLEDADGDMRTHLGLCRLAWRSGSTLFLHGGATVENIGVVPGRAQAVDVDAWIASLNGFLHDELAAFDRGETPADLIAYQAPLPGTAMNQTSVVYARPTDETANPHLPDDAVVAWLAASGVTRLVVGHTPQGDTPAVLRGDDGFELVLADDSYGRVESGSQVLIEEDCVRVRGVAELDDGNRVTVRFACVRGDGSAIGRRVAATGQLVKGVVAGGEVLLFKGLPERKVSQVLAREVRREDTIVAR